jgi:ATP-binding cassette subfamily B protein
MKPFPHYTQHDSMDCGATCLRMVAKHYGRSFSNQTLRERSFITHTGVSMLGISDAAESIGFRTQGVKITLSQLLEAPLPCILHWNQNHFVVLYKISLRNSVCSLWHSVKQKNNTEKHGTSTESHRGAKFFVSDPAGKLVKYTAEEFCKCWLSSKQKGEDVGTALLLEPTPIFYQQEEEKTEKRGFKFLFQYLKPYKSLVAQLFLGLLFGSLLQLIFPFLTQALVDQGIGNNNLGFIYVVLIAQLMLTLGSVSVDFIRGWIMLHLSTRINISLISDFLAKLMRLPMNYFGTKMTGDIIQRIGDHSRIKSFLTGSLFYLFSNNWRKKTISSFNEAIYSLSC